MSEPLYPLRLYICHPDGTHPGPIDIVSEEQLNGPGTKLIIKASVLAGAEVIMTDPADICVFHAKNREIIFPILHTIGGID